MRLACEDGRQIEAKAVDVHLGGPVAQRVGHHLQHARMTEVHRVTGAGVVDVVAGRIGEQAIVGSVVDALEAQRGPALVAFGRMVVDHVEDHFDSSIMQMRDHLLELRDRTGGGIPLVGRKESDRVVSPIIGDAFVDQMPVDDGSLHRQQLDRRDAEAADVLADIAHPESCELAPQLRRHRGMAHRKTTHVGLIQDRAVPRNHRTALASPRERRVHHAALGHERRAVALVERKIRFFRAELIAEEGVVPLQLTHQGLGVRVEEQLVRIEAMALLRRVFPVHPIAIYGAGPRIRQITVPNLVGVLRQRDALELALAAGIEQAQLDASRVRGEQREVDTETVPRRAQRVRQSFGNA